MLTIWGMRAVFQGAYMQHNTMSSLTVTLGSTLTSLASCPTEQVDLKIHLSAPRGCYLFGIQNIDECVFHSVFFFNLSWWVYPVRSSLTSHDTMLHMASNTKSPWACSSGCFYYHGLTLIPAWISNHMPSKVWGEITYPFLNFNGCTVEV